MFQDPTRGPDVPGMSEQRALERMDFRSPVGGFSGSQPGVFGQFPASPGPMQPYTPDMTFSMPDIGAMTPTGASMGAESGTGAASGAAGSALASGAGSLTSMGVGMLPGLIGGFAGADPATMAGLNILGAAAAPAAGGAVAGGMAGAAAGTGAASGAAAGAAGATAAAAPLAMVVGPYLVAKLIQGIHANADKKDLMQLQKRIQGIYGQLPGELQKYSAIPQLTSQLTKTSSPEQASGILKQLNTIQKDFQDNGWESYLKQGATTVKTTGAEGVGGSGNSTIDLPEVQKALANATNAYFPGLNLARLRATDLLERAGYSPERIKQETGRYISPQEFALATGRDMRFFDPESGSQAFSQKFNPYLEEHFNQPGLAADRAASSQAMLEAQMRAANSENVNFANPGNFMPQPSGGMWDEASKQAFAGFRPGYTEQGLSDLFDGQFSAGTQGALDQTGSMGVGLGGSDIGGAGKRSPQFITPELDNRSEASTGKLGGGQARPGQSGQPFGMRPQSGMGVGGRPQGNAPFGGMGRQMMQPQASGGVQTQRNRNSGVV